MKYKATPADRDRSTRVSAENVYNSTGSLEQNVYKNNAPGASDPDGMYTRFQNHSKFIKEEKDDRQGGFFMMLTVEFLLFLGCMYLYMKFTVQFVRNLQPGALQAVSDLITSQDALTFIFLMLGVPILTGIVLFYRAISILENTQKSRRKQYIKLKKEFERYKTVNKFLPEKREV